MTQPIPAAGSSRASPRRRPARPRNSVKTSPDLSSLLNHLPGMVYRSRLNKPWTMLFASAGCVDLLGIRPGKIVHSREVNYYDLIHPTDRETVEAGIHAALRENRAYDLIYRVRIPEGDEKWVRDRGRPSIPSSERHPTVEGFITDVTDRKQSELNLQRQIQRFESLRRIDIAITAGFDLQMILHILLDQVIQNLGVDATDVLLYNPTTQMLEFAAGRGMSSFAMESPPIRVGEGLAGRAALERRLINVTSEALIHRGVECRFPSTENQISTYLGVPLIVKGEVKGVLEAFHFASLQPDPEWLNFFEALAGQAAIAIDNATLFNDLQRSNLELTLAYDATLEGWSKALELRDQDTEGHTQRVTEMTLELAMAMGIKGDELQHIRRGALLHDIGKMGIPDSILLKPGPLTPQEWDVMRQHPTYAYQLLSPIPNLRPALDIPYCHHERWDGSGYPRRLKGEEIPLSARVFAVIDVWDALLSERPYRPAWTKDKAYRYIREQSGQHFEPRIVKKFLTLF